MNVRYRIIYFILISITTGHASSENLSYLNNMRAQAGLTPWSEQQQLTTAAQNHANYLQQHRARGHGEQRGSPGFTGANHVERMVYAGYPSRHGSENVSFHTYAAALPESIDGLMAAIYHRFAFLSMDYNEAGVGISQTGDFTSFVYNIGNSHKRSLCEQTSPPGTRRYYTKTCRDQQKGVDAQNFDLALHETRASNPNIVVFPPANSEGILPAFYEEEPDPLPNYEVSGFPVSVQFNPAYFPAQPPVITDWHIYDANDDKPLETIAYFNQQSDPHRKLTAYQHVLFPKQRLEWNHGYRVTLTYQVNNQPKELAWTFRTRDLSLPIYRIETADQYIKAKPGENFIVYIPPRNGGDSSASYRTTFRRQETVKIKFIDDHTLQIDPLPIPGSTTIAFQGRSFRIDVSP